MPDERNRNLVGPLFLRTQSDQILAPEDVASEVKNFEITNIGTLRSVRGPTPYVPDYGQGYPASYGTMHGIFHCLLDSGRRDVLLIHSGASLLEFDGKTQSWTTLVATSSGQLNRTLRDDSAPQFPCQFESTPKGVVIVPQGGSEPLIYDGDVILPLGYSGKPPSPQGFGPNSDGNDSSSVNTTGYTVDYYRMNESDQSLASGDENDRSDKFGDGRVGTLLATPGMVAPSASSGNPPNAGTLLPGSYRCAVQWVNYFGDISPLSPRSNPITWDAQDSDVDPLDTAKPARLDTVLKQILWASIPKGPTGTMGRILSRTVDERNKETTGVFILTGDYAGSTSGGFATIPDNITEVFPDNTSDAVLFTQPLNVREMPRFRLCKVSMGSLWVANTRSDPGILIPSFPGKWGTLQEGAEIYPDASGAEITGLWNTGGGLLAFTAESIYLIQPGYSGDQPFRSSTFHPTVGCAAPSSLAEMPNGLLVWLGMDAFYAFDGKKVSKISAQIKEQFSRISRSRARQATAAVDFESGEYRCWVAIDDSVVNNRCFVFDGNGWRYRTDTNLSAVCVTKDHRRYMIGGGRLTDSGGSAQDGVWVLDHAVSNYLPESRESRLETVWLAGTRSAVRKSALTVKLWLRETHTVGTLTVEVYRDWRRNVVDQTITFDLDSPEDTPSAWDSTILGSPDGYWSKSRPFWSRKDISIPSCESYKLVIKSSEPIEFVGLTVDESPRPNAMRMPRG